MARDAIVEAMVSQDTKNEAEKLCSRWGVSLSDAVNDFLVKCGNMQYVIKGLIILVACAIDMRKYLVRK